MQELYHGGEVWGEGEVSYNPVIKSQSLSGLCLKAVTFISASQYPLHSQARQDG